MTLLYAISVLTMVYWTLINAPLHAVSENTKRSGRGSDGGGGGGGGGCMVVVVVFVVVVFVVVV